MHKECMDWLRWVNLHKKMRETTGGLTVLEHGSLDINGSAREVWPEACWHGIDLKPGRGVDTAMPFHKFDAWEHDMVISVNSLEHDKYWALTLERIHKSCGQLVVISVSTGLGRRCDDGYHFDLAEDDIREVWDVEMLFRKYEFSLSPDGMDLRFWGYVTGYVF